MSAFLLHKVSLFADGIEEDQEKIMMMLTMKLGLLNYFNTPFPELQHHHQNKIYNITLHSTLHLHYYSPFHKVINYFCNIMIPNSNLMNCCVCKKHLFLLSHIVWVVYVGHIFKLGKKNKQNIYIYIYKTLCYLLDVNILILPKSINFNT